jgi:hypothetical protein
MAESHVVKVRMTADQLERLDELARERGQTRSAVLRGVLDHAGPKPVGADRTVLSPTTEVPPDRAWVLGKLAEAAAGGSVVAMTTLARELRLGGVPESLPVGPVSLASVPWGELRMVE